MSVVLALNSNQTEREQRIDAAMEFAEQRDAEAVLMIGGDAIAMCDYALANFRRGPRIVAEGGSKDTLEGAHAAKVELLRPNGWDDVDIFTNDFHAPRVDWIFKRVLGDSYEIRTHGVESKHMSLEQKRFMERREKVQLAVVKMKLLGVSDSHDKRRAARLSALRYRDQAAPLARLLQNLDNRTNIKRG